MFSKMKDMFQELEANVAPPKFRTTSNSSLQLDIETGQILRPGTLAPDFVLYDTRDGEVRLSDLTKEGPVVISFYRGGLCPFCALELQALQDELENIKALGAKLIAICPESSCWSLETRWKSKIGFQVLTDPENSVAKDFGVFFEVDKRERDLFKNLYQIDLERWNGPNSGWGMPFPGSFIVDQQGMIRYTWMDSNFSKRAEPEDIVHALREVVSSSTQCVVGTSLDRR